MNETFAFDIPAGSTAEQSGALVDASTPEGFYPWQIMAVPGALRVFCKRSKAAQGEQKATRTAEDAIADGHMLKILADQPRVTVGQARVLLGRMGIRRGTDWCALALTKARDTRR